jgi:hypothetical protein
MRAPRPTLAGLLIALVALGGGACDRLLPPPGGNLTPATPAPAPPIAQPAGVPATGVPSDAQVPPAGAVAQVPGATTPTAVPVATALSATQVSLSAGVALPQSLPQGTVMGFSVDYEFSGGGPVSGRRYLMVIQPRGGTAAEVEFQPAASGNWTAFVPELGPNQAPFTAQVVELAEDGTRAVVSAVERLQ